MMETEMPRLLRSRPMDATAIPLPTDETTPPVTKMNFGTPSPPQWSVASDRWPVGVRHVVPRKLPARPGHNLSRPATISRSLLLTTDHRSLVTLHPLYIQHGDAHRVRQCRLAQVQPILTRDLGEAERGGKFAERPFACILVEVIAHRDDEAWLDLPDHLGRTGDCQCVRAADRHEEHIDIAERGDLRVRQWLAEIAEVAERHLFQPDEINCVEIG